jgi:hypothetical protein
MVARSLPLCREQQARWSLPVLHEIGALHTSATTNATAPSAVWALPSAFITISLIEPDRAFD